MKCIVATITFLFSLTLFAQDSMTAQYKIYDTRLKQTVAVDKIVTDMADADIFFGEELNDSAGHYLENKIFSSLHARYSENSDGKNSVIKVFVLLF